MLKQKTFRQTPTLGRKVIRARSIVNTTIDHADKNRFPLPADFDPEAYLALNPDVAKNWSGSPASHWKEYGGGENRQYKFSQGQEYAGESEAMLGMGGTVSAPSNPTQNKGNTTIETIKQAASNVTPEKIEKGVELLQSGKGLISASQKAFGKGQTDPSRLPKTKALKEAEQTMMLPQDSQTPSSSLPFDKKWIFIIGGVLLVIIVIAYVKHR